MKSTLFASLPLKAAMLKNLASLDYHEMTPIQADSLPLILSGTDVIAQAKTGSGKTAAFGIGLLSRIVVPRFCIQGLVLCPTRELADQVSKELRRLARLIENVKILTLCGGVPFGPQFGSLEHGAHIVVGTPGRILDHLGRGSLDLKSLRMLVLDEADRMLDMGFKDDLDVIVAATPRNRQTLLFSATYPPSIATMSASIQQHPLTVKVDATHDDQQIEQRFFVVEADKRVAAVARILGHYRSESTLIFCNTKKGCQEVADALTERGFSALAIHGDLEQSERDQVLARFANKSVSVLVATDVAARGIDIKELAAVINYELSRDPEVHIHRIGRTGRAGEQGVALSLVAAAENRRATAIENYLGSSVPWAELESLTMPSSASLAAPMVTLCIDGGRKNKMRPGDVLGALTGEGGILGSEVGKINVFNFHTYVAIRRGSAKEALAFLSRNKIKGRFYKVRIFS
ncbi:ATP-dependent RNA helicase DbpA [Desulfuromusa kysingii]|uniref:ATP-dependent RNA helicase DbpA n=1 Tax=Desulfuromusa kysingii TaxID=37625 RepID=A0A1H3X8A4_9BACT|nr:ATP-dependent RNA helicase DbpA [Desulfuromusa kysingii]SDZ94894.1 ATP-dependent RNA helicase DbpA [Desulfuromusa kysingii]